MVDLRNIFEINRVQLFLPDENARKFDPRGSSLILQTLKNNTLPCNVKNILYKKCISKHDLLDFTGNQFSSVMIKFPFSY